jgi:cytochrome P450
MNDDDAPRRGDEARDNDSALIAMLGSGSFIEDPYPVYQELLRRPGWRTPSGYLVFSRYADVMSILRDPAVFGQETRPKPSFHVMDPPDHTRLRRLVSRAFTPRAVEKQRAAVAEMVNDLLHEVVGAGTMELMGDFASRLPAMVMAHLLNIPLDDGRRWQAYLDAMMQQRGLAHYLESEPGDRAARDEIRTKMTRQQADFLAGLIRDRQGGSGGDIVSTLLNAREGDESLTNEEVLITLLLLLGAGMHTTAGQIGNVVRALLEHPDQLRQLAADPGLLDNAVEEAFRFDGALQAEHRLVRKSGTVGGIPVSPGERVLIVNAAANRDPAVFENPDEFDIRRANARDHLTFGWGIHRCLGAPLAKLEIHTAIEQLLLSLPDLRIADAPRLQPYDRLRGLERLALAWTPQAAVPVPA